MAGRRGHGGPSRPRPGRPAGAAAGRGDTPWPARRGRPALHRRRRDPVGRRHGRRRHRPGAQQAAAPPRVRVPPLPRRTEQLRSERGGGPGSSRGGRRGDGRRRPVRRVCRDAVGRGRLLGTRVQRRRTAPFPIHVPPCRTEPAAQGGHVSGFRIGVRPPGVQVHRPGVQLSATGIPVHPSRAALSGSRPPVSAAGGGRGQQRGGGRLDIAPASVQLPHRRPGRPDVEQITATGSGDRGGEG